MTTFGADYAELYDALYRDKDYAAEAKFTAALLRSVLPTGQLALLDFGCGTGLHAGEFLQYGFDVTGIDRSADMIARAEERRRALPPGLRDRLAFAVGDLRTMQPKNRADAAVSLFHVLCYMVEEDDMQAALRNIRRALREGGAFVFDFWFEQAVFNDPPAPREKVVDFGTRQVKRTALPIWDRERSVVEVNYDISELEAGSLLRSHSERHRVRYFSLADIERLVVSAGFRLLRFGEWLTGKPPSAESFSVYCLACAA